MQVTHVQDHVTHAQLGGQESIELSVTDSADFMIMMSSTLYSNQILAVVREVICNAWDAHIEAGRTDIPINITIEGDKLTIRDYGFGISRAMIGPIYGVYGNSTKRNDGKQTGGFGLGCKAPFAYVDHFQVTSHHEGVKTVYNMTKASSNNKGKPGINPLFSMPTTESGMEILIHIEKEDVSAFRKYIRQVTRNGEMNALFNEEQCLTLPFSKAEEGYLILNKNPIDENTDTRIYVRYGNVIYPVPTHKDLKLNEISDFLHRLPEGRSYEHPVIVFQAKPHTIAVTPSRESLSMQEHTVAALQELTDKFTHRLKQEIHIQVIKVLDEQIAAHKEAGKADVLFTSDKNIPGTKGMKLGNFDVINNLTELAKYHASIHYPESFNFYIHDMRKRLAALVELKKVDKGLAHTFVRYLERTRHLDKNWWGRTEKTSKWVTRHIIAPVAVKMTEYPGGVLSPKKLYLIAPGRPLNYREFNNTHYACHAIDGNGRPYHDADFMPYLQKTVVLSHTKNFYKHSPTLAGCIGYVVGNVPKRIEEARDFWKNHTDFKVIDFLEDPKDLREKATQKTIKKNTFKGLLLGSEAFRNKVFAFTKTASLINTSHRRIENPEWYARISRKDGSTFNRGLQEFGNHVPLSDWFIRQYGKQGGYYSVVTQARKYKQAKPAGVFMADKLAEEMMKNDRLKYYWMFHMDSVEEKLNLDRNTTEILEIIYEDKKLREHFKIHWELTDEDKKWLVPLFYVNMLDRTPKLLAARMYYDSIPVSGRVADLCALIDKHTDLLSLLDISKVKHGLKNAKHSRITRKVLLTALEG